MANNDRGQSLISKYVWVIDTIYRAKKISFKELNEKWLDTDISRGVKIPKRTFDNWKYQIWDMFGIDIVNENRGEYRYYISNAEDINKNGLRSWLYNTFCVSNVLANSQSIKDRILLEYVPSGQEYLQTIIEAMKENRVLNITYYNYWKDEEYNFDVQPFCIKLFRQRWYMVARGTNSYYYEKGLRIYSLDRIRYLHKTEEVFDLPKEWNAKEFFDGCFGIILDQSVEVQPVKLKVSKGQANYLRDLKLHESQEEIERNEEYSIFTYRLRPCFDFQQEILWNGENVEVLEPLWLRNEITEKIKNMWKIYEKEQFGELRQHPCCYYFNDC
ncbi:MAG: WYL domain-containing protein [Bacteroidales bacterium]|nr:WYL domain-containing protein [Bacteroidales bacterium]